MEVNGKDGQTVQTRASAPWGPPDEGSRLLSALVRVEPGAQAPEPLGGQQAMSNYLRALEDLHELR